LTPPGGQSAYAQIAIIIITEIVSNNVFMRLTP